MATARANYWPDSKCARAFWGQHEVPPYKKLLADTTLWLEPGAGERWLDLGCGCGQLTQALWTKSAGTIGSIMSIDVAAENAIAIDRLRRELEPPDMEGKIEFSCANFSEGLSRWPAGSIDGIVSGLAIQYAESFSEAQKRFTTEAYERLLRDACRILKPGGQFVFSVNVPEPAWGAVALRSLPGILGAKKPVRFLGRSLRMMRYGKWLKQEARLGRFHFLPHGEVTRKLEAAGFRQIEHRLTYARQAYIFRCRRPA